MPQERISLRIKNNSDMPIRDVIILGGFSTNTRNDENIEITCHGSSYQELLHSISVCPLTIGSCYVSSNGNGWSPQMYQMLVLRNTDASGRTAERQIIFLQDPYQTQSGVLTSNTPFRIDGLTQLRYDTVLPNADVTLMFFSAQSVSDFRNPSTIRVLPISTDIDMPSRRDVPNLDTVTNNKTEAQISSFTNKFLKKAKKLN